MAAIQRNRCGKTAHECAAGVMGCVLAIFFAIALGATCRVWSAERGASAHAPALVPAPRYSWRGVHLDESRHFFGKETVKAILDQMALAEVFWLGEDKPGLDDFKRRAAIRREALVKDGVNAASLQ